MCSPASLPNVDAQVRPPVPERNSLARQLLDEPAEASYLTNHIRLDLGGSPVDLVPMPGSEVTARPSDLGLEGQLFVINAGRAPHVLSTVEENLAEVKSFCDKIRSLGWPFDGAVVFRASRAWVEIGIAVTGMDELDLELLTRGRDLPGVHAWGEEGLSFWPTSSREPRLGPVPVSIHSVEPGCPMRLRDRLQPCVPESGPWVGAAIERRMWWQAHHQLMMSAFGCELCGGRASKRGRAIPLIETYQPTRFGSWSRGPWLAADNARW